MINQLSAPDQSKSFNNLSSSIGITDFNWYLDLGITKNWDSIFSTFVQMKTFLFYTWWLLQGPIRPERKRKSWVTKKNRFLTMARVERKIACWSMAKSPQRKEPHETVTSSHLPWTIVVSERILSTTNLFSSPCHSQYFLMYRGQCSFLQCKHQIKCISNSKTHFFCSNYELKAPFLILLCISSRKKVFSSKMWKCS